MVAPALWTTTAEPGLEARALALRDDAAQRWVQTPAELPQLGARTGFRARWANARAAARLIDALAAEIERCPQSPADRRRWRESVRERLQRFGEERLGWPEGYRRLLLADEFFFASVAFAREARRFAPGLPLDELWQALRNVWIGNSLQLLLDLPVRLSPGLFAYSMLYPLTDNLLDDPRLGQPAKQAFGERFGRRLAGARVAPASEAEEAVFRLVAGIEGEFPRRAAPDVFASLLAIHEAQLRSLRQQDRTELDDATLLSLSCEKGGASVLADLWLVAGSASPEEERFAFGYGVFLQLLDDLQDVESDLTAGHQTLFTRAARRGVLDEPAARLAAYMDRVLDEAPSFAADEFVSRKDLIRRNCRSLLVGAVADEPARFSRRFRRAIESQWPVGCRGLRRLRHRAAGRFREVEGQPPLLEQLLTELETYD
jgi:hypothetical protein